MVDSQSLTVEENDGVVTVEFDRPNKRNALNVEMVTDLRDVLMELQQKSKHAIFLTGKGPVTTAGADTAVVGGDDDEQKRTLIKGINEIYELLQSHPRPTVMAAKGAAVGAGFQLAVICDFTIAGVETDLLKPEIKYGVFSGYSTAMLEVAVGGNVAREIALKGDTIPPKQALEWGIVSDIVPEAEVEDHARELVHQLSGYDSTAYAKTKETLGFDLELEDFENYP